MSAPKVTDENLNRIKLDVLNDTLPGYKAVKSGNNVIYSKASAGKIHLALSLHI